MSTTRVKLSLLLVPLFIAFFLAGRLAIAAEGEDLNPGGGGEATVIISGGGTVVITGDGDTAVITGDGNQAGDQGNQTEESTDPTVTTLLLRARGVLDALIPFIIGLAVFVIIWGIFSYIRQADNEEKRAEAKRFITYGLLGVFCMISIWGFVVILINTFSVEQRIQSGDIPTVPEIRSNE